MRLQKYMAHCGVASRRKSEEIISEKRVNVNGVTIDNPAYQVKKGDKVLVDGKLIKLKEDFKYFIINKPLGVVSTVSDEKDRVNVVDLVNTTARIYPVGRLDMDTSGLLVLTNDGEFTNIMTHPRYELEKTYIATVEGKPGKRELEMLRNGIKLDGKFTRDGKFRILRNFGTHSVIEVKIKEGRNRQVKRMFEAVNHPVKSLKRIKFGEIELGGLQIGEYRPFNNEELEYVEKIKDEFKRNNK